MAAHIAAHISGPDMIYNISNKIIGQGAYAKVYIATDQNQRKYAVKKCPIESDGIPNIFEIVIMKSLNHPNLNQAKEIYVAKKHLYIFQDLAQSNLAKKIRIDKGGKPLSLAMLRQTCFKIAQALAVLHKENIIHADIKPSNILVFDDDIKLSDFTLGLLKYYPDQKFNHVVCSPNYRPFESYFEQEWDQSLDIWSLGCTFYEMCFGHPLFRNQFDRKIKTEKIRQKQIKQRTIKAICQWAKLYNDEIIDPKIIEKYNDPVDILNINPNFDCYSDFGRLIVSMLKIDPNKRSDIYDILNHNFFTGLTLSGYDTIKRKSQDIPIQEYARISFYINNFLSEIEHPELIKKMVIELYSKILDIKLNEKIKAAASVQIIGKIIKIDNIDFRTICFDDILNAERKIANYLNFHLLI